MACHPLLSIKFCDTFRYTKFDPDVKVARLNVIIQLKSVPRFDAVGEVKVDV